MSEPFIAEVRMFANNFAPRGWSYCDGQDLPIAQNSALFALIGTLYGGDGRTTVGLPDLRARVPMHSGRGPGLSDYRVGEQGGVDKVTIIPSEMPQHNHSVYGLTQIANQPGPSANAFLAIDVNAGVRLRFLNPNINQPTSLSSTTLADAGATHSHENQQPFTVVSFCIALLGLFPSRS